MSDLTDPGLTALLGNYLSGGLAEAVASLIAPARFVVATEAAPARASAIYHQV